MHVYDIPDIPDLRLRIKSISLSPLQLWQLIAPEHYPVAIIIPSDGESARLGCSVWASGPPKEGEKTYGKHPTQKPLELLTRIAPATTREGDLILDPFTSSSTSGLAAYLRGRRFVGIDTARKYIDLSIKRFKELIGIEYRHGRYGLSLPDSVTWGQKVNGVSRSIGRKVENDKGKGYCAALWASDFGLARIRRV